MTYIFRGFVREVGADLCWLDMRDLTEPSNPDESWCVALARLPKVPAVGEYVTFTITDKRATFKFDRPRKWTERDLRRIKRKAEEYAKVFGVYDEALDERIDTE